MTDDILGGDPPAQQPNEPESESSGEGLEKATKMVDKGASLGRDYMALIVPALLPIAGLLAFFASLYFAFEFLTHDFLEIGDVIVASFGIVAATFVYLVVLAIHGFHIFQEVRTMTDIRNKSTKILKSIAGALRGHGEAFLIAVIIAVPFLGLQALIAERDAPVPLFGTGLVGIVVSPVVYAVMVLVFSYLTAEVLETLVGIREEKNF